MTRQARPPVRLRRGIGWAHREPQARPRLELPADLTWYLAGFASGVGFCTLTLWLALQ
jgi:hypothetical protein